MKQQKDSIEEPEPTSSEQTNRPVYPMDAFHNEMKEAVKSFKWRRSNFSIRPKKIEKFQLPEVKLRTTANIMSSSSLANVDRESVMRCNGVQYSVPREREQAAHEKSCLQMFNEEIQQKAK